MGLLLIEPLTGPFNALSNLKGFLFTWRIREEPREPLKRKPHRITLNPEVYSGKPTICNMQFTVAQLLELLAAGMSAAEIPKDYPYMEAEDIQACLVFAAKMANVKSVTPLAG